MEYLKQFGGIIFGYEINVFSDYKNLVYVATLSESQRVVRWRLIIKVFGPNIQYIAVVINIVADTLSRLPYTPSNKYNPCTRKAQSCANDSFPLRRIENNKYLPPVKYLNCTKRTIKGTEKYKFQTQYIHFGSSIWLLHAIY